MRSDRSNRRAHPETTQDRLPSAWLVVRRAPRLSAAASALAALWVLACGAPGDSGDLDFDSKESTPITVEMTVAKPEELRLVADLTGSFVAEYSVLIRPEIPGVVEAFHGTEGKPVSRGDVLFTLRNAEQRARLLKAQAELRLAKDVFDRTSSLTSRDISSVSKRAEAVAGLDAARAEVDLTRLELDRTKVLAPFDGVLGTRLVAPGDRVTVDDPLIQIDAIERLQLIFTIPESGVRLARTGAMVEARVVSYPDQRFQGEVFFVSPTIDPATRRLILKAWVRNEDHALKPGMFANVAVEVSRKPNALLVAESSVVYDRNGTYLWRVDEEGLAEKIPVTLGVRQNGRVEVTEGIAAGDRIITAGTNKVMAGRAVRPHVAPLDPSREGPVPGADLAADPSKIAPEDEEES